MPTGAELQLSFAPIVQRVAPAVVNVYATKVVASPQSPCSRIRCSAASSAPRRCGGPRERVQRSLGSGVIVDPPGLVVTNNHVIEGATEVKVALADKREFEAEIVLKDQRTDLAVLRIKDAARALSGARVRRFRRARRSATWCWRSAIPSGRPDRDAAASSRRSRAPRSASPTISSSSRPTRPSIRAIPAARWSTAGQLVGINTAIFSRSGGSIGIGFAIPSNMVQGGRRLGAERRQLGHAAVARRQAAGRDRRYCRRPRAEAAGAARWLRASAPAVRRPAPA